MVNFLQQIPTHQHCRDNHILPPREPAEKFRPSRKKEAVLISIWVLVKPEQRRLTDLNLGLGYLNFGQTGKIICFSPDLNLGFGQTEKRKFFELTSI